MRSANGLVSTGGEYTDAGFGFDKSEQWPGDKEAALVEAVKEKDEVEVPMQMGACVIS